MTMTTVMDDANGATAWTLELTRAGNDISQFARRLQTEFNIASEKSVQKGEAPIPDPVKLLRRLAALESRIEQLRRDCVDVAKGRNEIVVAVTDMELKNAHILRKISEATEHASMDEDEATTPLEDNWISLASAIEEQHELFSTQDNS